MIAGQTAQTVAQKSVKALLGVAAMLSIGTTLVACDGNDAAIIGGTIAIVAGASGAFDDNDHGHRPPPRHDDHRDDHRGPDRGGPGRGGWDDGRGPGRGDGPGRGPHRYAAGFELAGVSKSATPANNIAAEFGLPLESAEKVNALLVEAAKGNTTMLANAGLSNAELQRVASYKLPSDAALDQLGSQIALSRTNTKDFVLKLMAKTKAQMADISSPAWTACQATGKWKTDANGGTCESTSWSGCSPETGASMCASVN